MSKRKFCPSGRESVEERYYNRISKSCIQKTNWLGSKPPSNITINIESLVGQIAITKTGALLTGEQVVEIERQVTEALLKAVANIQGGISTKNNPKSN